MRYPEPLQDYSVLYVYFFTAMSILFWSNYKASSVVSGVNNLFSINSLIQRLADYTLELEQARETLEIRVSDRTQ